MLTETTPNRRGWPKIHKTDMMTIHRKGAEQSFQFSITQSMINTAILTFVIVFYALVVWFYALCVLNKWDLKLPAHLEAKSHWLHLFVFFQCVSLDVFLKSLDQSMHNHIGCICLILFLSEFSNVSSNDVPERKQNCKGCIYTIFLRCEFSNVRSD